MRTYILYRLGSKTCKDKIVSYLNVFKTGWEVSKVINIEPLCAGIIT